MYNKARLSLLGKCKVKVRNPRNNKLYRLEFQVIDQHDEIPLLGRKAIKVQYDNILAIAESCNKHEIMEKVKINFQDVFTGDGCMEGENSIEINKNVPPVKLPKCRVPVAKMAPLKQEL